MGANFRIDDNEAVLNWWESEPAVSLSNDGNAIVVWLDQRNGTEFYGDPDIYARRFDASGKSLGPSYRLHNDMGKYYQSDPDVQIRNGLVYHTWVDGRMAGQGLLKF